MIQQHTHSVKLVGDSTTFINTYLDSVKVGGDPIQLHGYIPGRCEGGWKPYPASWIHTWMV